jgi:hypothetical protein
LGVALSTETLEDLRDKLDLAILGQVLTVTTSDGKSVTYRSMADMLTARRMVGAQLGENRKTRLSYLKARDEGT